MRDQEDNSSSLGGVSYFKRNLSNQNSPGELPGMNKEVIPRAKSYSRSGS